MLKVLLVDDSNDRTELIERKLDEAGLLSHIALTRCIGADSARSELLEPADLMILDVLLPKKDDGTPQALHSLNLLKDLADGNKPFIRPKMIIGLTADIEGLKSHQTTFLESASIVLDGGMNNLDWIDKLIQQITISVAAVQKSEKLTIDQVLISVHGIRTYGTWQSELSAEVKKYSRSFEFIEIKYGYLDLLRFLSPSRRENKANEIGLRLAALIQKHKGRKISIVAHSFGSLIVSKAFENILPETRVNVVVLCGSPLSETTNIDHIVDASNLTVNECGLNDATLLLSKFIVPGLGYAGRIGFYRENTSQFLNRYHKGGHSLYFKKKDNHTPFYQTFWTPIIIDHSYPAPVDSRPEPIIMDVSTAIIRCIVKIKEYKYISMMLATSVGAYFLFR